MRDPCKELLRNVIGKYTSKDSNFQSLFSVPNPRNHFKTVSNHQFAITDLIKFPLSETVEISDVNSLMIVAALIKVWWLRNGSSILISSESPLVVGRYINLLFEAFEDTWFPANFELDLSDCGIWLNWIKSFASVIAQNWFQQKQLFRFEANDIGDEWLAYLADIIKQVWFVEDVRLTLGKNKITSDGLKYLAQVIREIWLAEWVEFYFNDDPTIGDKGLIAFSEVLSQIGFRKKFILYMVNCNITDEWFQSILSVVEKFWFSEKMQLVFEENAITDAWAESLLKIINMHPGNWAGVIISSNKISRKMKHTLESAAKKRGLHLSV